MGSWLLITRNGEMRMAIILTEQLKDIDVKVYPAAPDIEYRCPVVAYFKRFQTCSRSAGTLIIDPFSFLCVAQNFHHFFVGRPNWRVESVCFCGRPSRPFCFSRTCSRILQLSALLLTFITCDLFCSILGV